jgi:ABC-type antimicrobial peptide transport system permease subunit
VERRAQEIGIRLALGAAGGAVSRMMMAEVALVAAAGIVAGAAGAVAATRVLRGLLFGAAGSGVPLFLAAGALLLGIAALAAYLPARRAARLDPMVALRRE